MKFTIARDDFNTAMASLAGVVEKRNTIPILANVRLAADADAITLTATDLDIELALTIPAKTDTTGSTTCDAGLLRDIARKSAAGGQICFETEDKGDRAIVRAGRAKFTLQCLPAGDFPDLDAGELTIKFSLPGKTLAALLKAVAYSISTEETRYYLNGVYFHSFVDDGAVMLRAVSTDGHRLARNQMPAPEGARGAFGVIIPAKACAHIIKLAGEIDGDVMMAVSERKIRLTMPRGALTSKVVDGTFPDYARVIPTANGKRAILDTAALTAALERVTTISSERGRAVKWTLTPGQLELSVVNPDAGEARDSLEADYDGPDFEIGFNGRYALDTIAALGGDTILVKLGDPGGAATAQLRDGADLLCVLMPMRV